MRRSQIGSLPLWGRAGVGASTATNAHLVANAARLANAAAPIPPFPQRGKEQQP
ncbi:hypothetical protein ABIC63_002456 [Pseudacidovorax sp. 1753]